MERNILYLHGMGGGSDSRIPKILSECFAGKDLRVVVRTYDFDPAVATGEIARWTEELRPAVVVGESLGSVHALRIRGIPHILVSPALGAPLFLSRLAWSTRIPGVGALCGRIWKPREGDRQKLSFTAPVMKNYGPHLREALRNTPSAGSGDYFFAFFGTRDHYRRSGVVSVSSWKKRFGADSCLIYEGTHYMEEQHVRGLLAPAIERIASEQNIDYLCQQKL